MTNPIWEQNLSCLPDRLRQVLPAHDQPSPSIQIIQGEKGWPVARIKTSNGSIHTNSLVDPLE
ncbi:hypothetical protein MXD81_24970, partial [Microbacteriaceae bacterium K1510]|nr:hypothetical protein [Microbacteriaceae bacterium K1510]